MTFVYHKDMKNISCCCKFVRKIVVKDDFCRFYRLDMRFFICDIVC